MELRAGTRLHSAVCETGIIIVKPPKRAGDIRCGGVPMLGAGEDVSAAAVLVGDAGEGTLLGKRYVCEEVGLEVLCTKAGIGSLAFDDVPLVQQGAKPLPPSD